MFKIRFAATFVIKLVENKKRWGSYNLLTSLRITFFILGDHTPTLQLPLAWKRKWTKQKNLSDWQIDYNGNELSWKWIYCTSLHKQLQWDWFQLQAGTRSSLFALAFEKCKKALEEMLILGQHIMFVKILQLVYSWDYLEVLECLSPTNCPVFIDLLRHWDQNP